MFFFSKKTMNKKKRKSKIEEGGIEAKYKENR